MGPTNSDKFRQILVKYHGSNILAAFSDTCIYTYDMYVDICIMHNHDCKEVLPCGGRLASLAKPNQYTFFLSQKSIPVGFTAILKFSRAFIPTVRVNVSLPATATLPWGFRAFSSSSSSSSSSRLSRRECCGRRAGEFRCTGMGDGGIGAKTVAISGFWQEEVRCGSVNTPLCFFPPVIYSLFLFLFFLYFFFYHHYCYYFI